MKFHKRILFKVGKRDVLLCQMENSSEWNERLFSLGQEDIYIYFSFTRGKRKEIKSLLTCLSSYFKDFELKFQLIVFKAHTFGFNLENFCFSSVGSNHGSFTS